jgi:hypothetical protein
MLRSMNQFYLSIRGFFLFVILLLAAVFAAGCGSSGDDLTVTTGSLSKTEFTQRADTICKAGRTQFDTEYSSFVKHHSKALSSENEELLGELVETILLPNYEKRIEEISGLGAPRGNEQEIAVFLNAFKQRLDELKTDPAEMTKTSTPFTQLVKLAANYGLTGCAESLS